MYMARSINFLVGVVILLCLAVVISSAAYASAAASKPPVVFLNGEKMEFDVAPIIINGNTLVPMRRLFEALGAKVEWEGSTRTVTATRGSTIIEYNIGAASAKKNGESIRLPVPGRVINGSTVFPLRFVSEALGASVQWDEKSHTITIKSAVVSSDNNVWQTRSDLDGDGSEELLSAREVIQDTGTKHVLSIYDISNTNLSLLSETEIFQPLLFLRIETADIISGGNQEILITDAGEYPSYALYEWSGNELKEVDLKDSGIESPPQQVGIFNEAGVKPGLIFSHRISPELWQMDYYVWSGSKFELFDQWRLSEEIQ